MNGEPEQKNGWNEIASHDSMCGGGHICESQSSFTVDKGGGGQNCGFLQAIWVSRYHYHNEKLDSYQRGLLEGLWISKCWALWLSEADATEKKIRRTLFCFLFGSINGKADRILGFRHQILSGHEVHWIAVGELFITCQHEAFAAAEFGRKPKEMFVPFNISASFIYGPSSCFNPLLLKVSPPFLILP